VELLQVYSRVRRAKVEVYFDGAPAGQAGMRSFGTVKAHFILSAHTADSAILARLQSMRVRAAEVTVISSDRQVQAGARALRAAVIDSDTFARSLLDALSAPHNSPTPSDRPVTPDEVEKWLEIFQKKK
jgi:predicted RNA-binding protein with PIN domain